MRDVFRLASNGARFRDGSAVASAGAFAFHLPFIPIDLTRLTDENRRRANVHAPVKRSSAGPFACGQKRSQTTRSMPTETPLLSLPASMRGRDRKTISIRQTTQIKALEETHP
jgi:hypothetical protein